MKEMTGYILQEYNLYLENRYNEKSEKIFKPFFDQTSNNEEKNSNLITEVGFQEMLLQKF